MQSPVHLLVVLAIGAALGLLSTLGVFFDRREEGKGYILAAGTIRGALVAILVASTLPSSGGWLSAAALGAVYGAVVAIMVILSHGKRSREHALYILPPSVISGVLIGILTAYVRGHV